MAIEGTDASSSGNRVCSVCNNQGSNLRRWVKCGDCDQLFHASCKRVNDREFRHISKGKTWFCQDCAAPCTMCTDPVRNGQRGLDCDKCGSWTHNLCGGMDNDTYDDLVDSSFDWVSFVWGNQLRWLFLHFVIWSKWPGRFQFKSYW